jgi:hypothetical protein
MDERWLPEGHHYDLHIERLHASLGAGPFTGGGWKLCWHITVSPWETADSMAHFLCQNRVEPHFVIGGKAGREHPTVIQLLPLDVAGRALKHVFQQQTNKANVIQVEICATPESVQAFTDWHYKAFGNLAQLIQHRVDIPTRCARTFQNTKRFTANGYPRVKGHHGHMHVPGNDHFDPTTAFSGAKLCKYIKSAPNAL